MYELLELRQRLGVGQRAEFVGKQDFTDKTDAQRLVDAAMKMSAHAGYNEENGYWWCRGEGDTSNRLFVIQPIPSASTTER
jgi:hypothetical protein